MADGGRLAAGRREARRARLQAGARPSVELVLELRDLVHDHLGSRGLLHDVRSGVQQRRARCDLVGLADRQRAHPSASRSACPSSSSAYPTAGGPYWWADKLGGPGWSWFTGWFNVIGLVAVVASVDYVRGRVRLGALQPLGSGPRRGQLRRRRDPGEIFVVFAVILLLHAADQHLLVAPGRAVQQHLGVLALCRAWRSSSGSSSSSPTTTRAWTSSSPRRSTTRASRWTWRLASSIYVLPPACC